MPVMPSRANARYKKLASSLAGNTLMTAAVRSDANRVGCCSELERHGRTRNGTHAVNVTAFPGSHGELPAYGSRFQTPDRTVVISGDIGPPTR